MTTFHLLKYSISQFWSTGRGGEGEQKEQPEQEEEELKEEMEVEEEEDGQGDRDKSWSVSSAPRGNSCVPLGPHGASKPSAASPFQVPPTMFDLLTASISGHI